MKTPSEIIETAPSRWGAPRLADLLRGALANPKKRTPAELAKLEQEWKQREATDRAAHEAAQAKTWPTHLRLCGAPEEAASVLATTAPLATPALATARQALAEGLRTVLLSGYTGTGKTVGACELFRVATRKETRTGQRLAEWDSSAGLFLRWTRVKRVSDYLTEDRMLYQRACTVRVLVLDDLGGMPGETLGARHRELLEELADRRDRPGLVTGYTTNLPLVSEGGAPSAFRAWAGDRVVSRMCRKGTYLLRDCGARDLRQEGGR
ncbi:hypothetical protein D7X74_41155 [Corallococcus sp. CA047B]|uniref:hypothetical protein n=1 Tax=Corallococcus sp. CA047B TaxID=2316729 RepID=UPI000EA09C83|nr:hypothetical protein [Corallococcus sp. CA047B]RKG97014.1 hypothetical protein D7X74_41155 [Corallococcus sp. CA047B]